MDKLSLGIVSRTFFFVPVWCAVEQGLFVREGLDVAIDLFGNAPQAEPLLDGRYHVSICNPESVLHNAANGGPLRMAGGNCGLIHFMITQPELKTFDSLRGKTIGILNQAEGTFHVLKQLMAKHGLQFPGDYNVRETGGVPARHKALQAREIDAGLQSIPLNFAAEELGYNNLGDINDTVPDWQFTSVNVNRDWALAHEDVMVRFLRALLAGTRWMYEHREGAIAVAEREMQISRDYAARGWAYLTGRGLIARDLRLNHTALSNMIATLSAAGLLPAGMSTDPAPFIDYRWLDRASLPAA